MSDLSSGKYEASTAREVIYWPEPDKDGTGDEVWIDRIDNEGRSLGRFQKTDQNGEVVYSYPAPEGFSNRPSFTHEDNYVKVGKNGQIYRNQAGEAVSIKPGQALVLNPDGTHQYLNDEYERVQFAKAHTAVGGNTTPVADNKTDGDKGVTPPVGGKK